MAVPTLTAPLALSTMWMQLRHESVTEFAAAAAALGFRHVEVGHVVTPDMLVAPALGGVSVRVLHHPCPNPGDVPELADLDGTNRRRAVAAARETLQMAARLGAGTVVLHLGLVTGLDRRWENALRSRWLAGQRDTPAFDEVVATIERVRAATAPRHLDAARRSLAELEIIAADLDLTIGLENGEWVAAIPSLDELRDLLANFEPDHIGAWLDTGHATILERLGGAPLLAWAEAAGPRLLGLHLHDVAGLRDHLLPGLGTVDFRALAPLLPPEALPTAEFDWYYSPDEIRAGAAWLAEAGLVPPLG